MLKTKQHTVRRSIVQRNKSYRGPTDEVTNNVTQKNHVEDVGFYRVTESQHPNWRTRLALGLDCTTYMSAFESRIFYSPGKFFRRLVDTTQSGVHPYYGQSAWESNGLMATGLQYPTTSVVGTIAKANNGALSEYIKHCREAMTKFSTPTFIGELGDTLRMFKAPVQTLRRRVDQYTQAARHRSRRGGLTDPRVKKRVLRDTWLEYAFGMKPLMSDAESAAEALASLEDNLIRESVHGKSSATQDLGVTGPHIGQGLNTNILRWNYSRSYDFDAYIKYYGKVYVETSPEGKRLASRTFGFSLDEFYPTAWELIPYSFLVDYFTNAGEIISAFSFKKSNLLWTTKMTRFIERSQALGFIPLPMALGAPYVIKSQSWKAPFFKRENKSVLRDHYTGSLVPQFEFEIPGFRSLKWLNIAALARNRSLSPPNYRGISS